MCGDYLNVLVLLSKEAQRMSATYRSELMYVKNIGSTIREVMMAHHTSIFGS
jgi:hypothetical protein